jgi:hypothetical protein
VFKANFPTQPQPFGDTNEMENPEGTLVKPPKEIFWRLLNYSEVRIF